MKEIELKKLRKKREKHFLQEDGTIIAKVYGEDIHFKKGNEYKEIDNTLVKENGYYTNNKNEYKVYFKENSTDSLMKVEEDNHFLEINLLDSNNVPVVKKDNISKLSDSVIYEEVLNGIDLEYKVMPTKVKENIIIKNKNSVPNKLCFSVKTNLQLEIDNKAILAKNNGKIVFTLDAPYMIDSNNNYNKEIYYNLIQAKECYKLELILDKEWLDNAIYPVVIDPTITNEGQNNSVYDTYIYQGDTGTDRNSQDVLKVGVEKVNNQDIINRTLIKFDLPTIGTGSQVVEAILSLVGYPIDLTTYDCRIINIHRVTEDWDETAANWNNINDKYDPRIEASFEGWRNSEYIGTHYTDWINGANLTNLVRKWYANTPNNGILLKLNDEKYVDNNIPMFFSKNNTESGDNPKPILSVVYRNQNGLEDYMNYIEQNFENGDSFVNSYNGNLTTVFDLGGTVGGTMPVNLNLVYNTNDVILNNNIGYGKGFRLNFTQTLKEENIDGVTYLEYVDEDGTIHYFVKENDKYIDEDGLNLTVEDLTNEYLLTDSDFNKLKFIKNNGLAYLSEIKDPIGNIVTISYNSDNKISKIIDATGNMINLTYETNKMTVLSPYETVHVNYDSDKILNITTNLGVTMFVYNDKNIISAIIDETGKRINYEYCNELPYRIKKVSEIGLENEQGQFFEVSYGFDSTTFKDNKNRVQTITFNSFGNPISFSSLSSNETVDDAYGSMQRFDEGQIGQNSKTKNRLLESNIPNKYIKNYLRNTSFEQSTLLFNGDENCTLEISNEQKKTGNNSLKVTTNNENSFITQEVNVSKGHFYTFSAYINNSNKLRLSLSYLKEDEFVEEISDIISINENFEKFDISINYPEDANSNLVIKIYFDEAGTTYIDDIQLEEGEVANRYNMLENSDFSNGLTDWTLECIDTEEFVKIDPTNYFEVVSLDNGKKALKIIMNPVNRTSLSKDFNIDGKLGDRYQISFWYKNEGFIGEYGLGASIMNDVAITFRYLDESYGRCVLPSRPFVPNENEWQYFEAIFFAEKDYNQINLEFSQVFNANNLYITNLCLFKDARNIVYNYDENGNLKYIGKLDNNSQKLKYDKNNQLIKLTDEMGKSVYYENDNEDIERVLNSITSTGIYNSIYYDSFGNPIKTSVIKKMPIELNEDNYIIRLKGTEKCLRYKEGIFDLIIDKCGHNIWKFEKEGEYYTIQHPILLNKYLTIKDNTLKLSDYDNDNSLFSLIKNDNGSYLIKLKSNENYLKFNENTIIISSLIEDDCNFQFYIETINNEFIENTAEYTEDGKFITKTIDENLNVAYYNYDNNGLLKTFKDANENIITYNYDNNKNLININLGNRNIYYDYNSQNKLSKITQGTNIFNFIYDNFLNLKQLKIGNTPLITNNYEENNGNLLKLVYGNNNELSFEYDYFDRIKKLITMDNEYNFKYDNSGNLAKIIAQNEIIKYNYDFSKKLVNYCVNEFSINYKYNGNDNIINSIYKLEDNIYTNDSTYNDDEMLIKSDFGDTEINYAYDNLSRLVSINANNVLITNYKYVTNGKRTTLLIKSLKNNGDEYEYKYDKNNNVTHIYHNNNLENRYYYDNYNQLIKEKNYIYNEHIIYIYDNSGNLLNKKTYDLNSFNIKSDINFEYNNSEWQDQLTKYGEQTIIYDGMGNVTNIGANISLNWINGRQLIKYVDSSNQIDYKYNKDGIRTSKIVNSVETNYYLENDTIVLEKCGDSVISYIYDELAELVGFRYDGNIYYYIKNAQKDIIAIIDEQSNLVCKYQYDSWGNLISILDENDMDISSNNSHIGNINPFRYRQYYYDKETKLYYLNSRYYNPSWGRFISVDSALGTNADTINYNLYNYCNNNPINQFDPSGEIGLILSCMIIGAVAGALSGGIIGAAKSKAKTGKVSAKEVVKGAAVGAAVGTVVGLVVGTIAKTAVTKATTGTSANVGKIGEKFGGANKKKTTITVNNRKRIPDILNEKKKIIGDVKNVKKLSYTRQLRDFNTYATEKGYKMIVRVRSNTQLSGALQRAVKEHKIIIKYLPW